MSSQAPVFRRRTLAALVTVGGLAFLAMGYLLIYGAPAQQRTAGANAYSVSAVGHRAFVELLDRAGVPVVLSRSETIGRDRAGSLAILAEPASPDQARELAQQVGWGPTVLLVLPKWRGQADPLNTRWVADASLLDTGWVTGILEAFVPGASIVRSGSVTGWQTNSLGPAPTIEQPQLIRGGRIRPLVASEAGILLGEVRRGISRVWVLSDPDVLANHGIWRGDNASFALALVDALRDGDGPVVIDETIHGFLATPSLWRALLEPPFLPAMLQAVVALALLVWAGAMRFGRPAPQSQAVKPGAMTLVDTGANLLRSGPHGGYLLQAYGDLIVQDVARRLQAPKAMRARQLDMWFERIGRARSTRHSYSDLRRALDTAGDGKARGASGILTTARRLYRWRRDLLDES